MVMYPLWIQKNIILYDTTWGAPPYWFSTKRPYLRGRLRQTTARRLSAYMLSRALVTNTASSFLLNSFLSPFPVTSRDVVRRGRRSVDYGEPCDVVYDADRYKRTARRRSRAATDNRRPRVWLSRKTALNTIANTVKGEHYADCLKMFPFILWLIMWTEKFQHLMWCVYGRHE